jgi:hypothetical protein
VVSSGYVNDQPYSLKEYQQQDMLAVRFSPDSRRLATISTHFQARVWDAANGEPQWLLTGPHHDPSAGAVVPEHEIGLAVEAGI